MDENIKNITVEPKIRYASWLNGGHLTTMTYGGNSGFVTTTYIPQIYTNNIEINLKRPAVWMRL